MASEGGYIGTYGYHYHYCQACKEERPCVPVDCQEGYMTICRECKLMANRIINGRGEHEERR